WDRRRPRCRTPAPALSARCVSQSSWSSSFPCLAKFPACKSGTESASFTSGRSARRSPAGGAEEAYRRDRLPVIRTGKTDFQLVHRRGNGGFIDFDSTEECSLWKNVLYGRRMFL